MSGALQLPVPDEPNPAAAELREKLEHAQGYLRDAEHTRSLIAVSLTDDDAPETFREALLLELHPADLRVALWRDVVADLRRRLADL